MLLYPTVKANTNVQSRVALVGPRKSGISLLARCFIHEILDPADSYIFWVNARTQQSIEQAYDNIVERTHTHFNIKTSTELIYYLSWQIKTDWIMIFDSVDHQTAHYLASQNRLPQGLRGRILFTVEDQSCLGILGPPQIYRVPEPEWLEIIDSLASRLIASFVPSNFHNPPRDYLPETRFMELVTKESIEAELRKIEDMPVRDGQKNFNRASREVLARWICEKASKTFAIAVQCEPDPHYLLLSMALFKAGLFDDRNLPLPDPLQSTPPQKVFHKKVWTSQKIHDFYNKQWHLLVPVFSPDQYSYNLLNNCIFPFTKEDVTPKVGAFGYVHKVRVHPDHQRRYSMQHVSRRSSNKYQYLLYKGSHQRDQDHTRQR